MLVAARNRDYLPRSDRRGREGRENPAGLERRIGFERDRELPRIDELLILAHGALDIGCVDQPEAVTQEIDHLEDGEGLFGRPVIRYLQAAASTRSGHDFLRRRRCARCSARSRASLNR